MTLVALESGCTNGKMTKFAYNIFKSSGLDVEMQYGDSQTGSFARGVIGNDAVDHHSAQSVFCCY